MSSSRLATATFNLPEVMPEYRTYCIIGQGRGGTSMMAKLVDRLDIPLTKTTGSEDHEFRNIVQATPTNPNYIDKIKSQLEKRNVRPVWAWKIPQCGENLPFWYKLIRNPFWIYIIRDHLASALTEVRVNVVNDAIQGLNVKQLHEKLFYDFIVNVKEEKAPILLVSYERLRLHKGQFLLDLIKFLGTNPSIEKITNPIDFIEEEGPLQGVN